MKSGGVEIFQGSEGRKIWRRYETWKGFGGYEEDLRKGGRIDIESRKKRSKFSFYVSKTKSEICQFWKNKMRILEAAEWLCMGMSQLEKGKA